MFSEAAERNKEPILGVLRKYVAPRQRMDILEIGSGTAQHAVFFAKHFSQVTWHPSDVLDNLDGIAQIVRRARLPNLELPFELNVNQFPLDRSYDLVYTANTAHIMSFGEVEQMFAGVAQVLEPGGYFFLYGPVNRDGQFTSDSNRHFDHQLRANAGHMGLRDDRALDQLAVEHGLERIDDVDIPANNRVLVWQQATA